MLQGMEKEIEQVIVQKVGELNRPDLLRTPLVAFSSSADEKYPKLKQLVGEWHQNPREILPDAETVISYFVPFTKPVAAQPKTVEHGSALWGEAYLVINPHFENVNAAIIAYLTSRGFSATGIPATHTYEPETIECKWSHRSAAEVAGLGAFGANRMLITEKGSAGRFCTVLTSAPLAANCGPAQSRCPHVKNGSCGKCFSICPVGALRPGEFDKFACQEELFRNKEQNRDDPKLCEADTCGKCISVCPLAYIE